MLSHLERCPQEQLGHMHRNSGGYLADHGRKQCLPIVHVARDEGPIQKQNHQHGRIQNKLLGRLVEHQYLLGRELQQKKEVGMQVLVVELEVVDVVDDLQQIEACPVNQGGDRRQRKAPASSWNAEAVPGREWGCQKL